MKRLLLVISLGLSLTACTNSTRYGACVGIVDDEDPRLIYSISKWNVLLGIILSETLIIPGIIITKQLECPRGVK